MEQNILKAFPIFSDFPEQKLAEIAQWAKVSKFELNETIFKFSDDARHLYGVVEGEVELSLSVKDEILRTNIEYEESIQTHIETTENEIIVDTISPGEIFGWSSLTETQLFTSDARCSEPARIFSLPADNLKMLFNKMPQLGFVFMTQLAEIISQRLRKRTEILAESWAQAFGVNRV